MSKRLVLVSFLVLVLLGSASLLAASTRFLARIDGSLVGTTTDPRCTALGPEEWILIQIEGTGRINGHGPVTVAATHCVIDDPAEPAIEEGEMTLTEEDGSTLELSYRGTDNAGDLEGTFMVTGGTGVWTGASGTGTFSGMAGDLDTGFLLLRGRITVP